MFSAQQEFILRHGRVPAKKRTVKRTRLLQQLYTQLQAVINRKSQWLVVHGMPGTGKTQLAIDLLYDKPEIVFGHFNKIFWLADRNLDPQRIVDVATDALLMSFPELDSLPPTLQSLGQLLHAQLDCLSKVLVVLDGVMLADTVRFFDNYKTNRCVFLATTTSREIFSCVQNATFFEINSSNALEREQLVELTAHYKLPHLSPVQLEVLAEVSGNNLAVLEKLLPTANGNIQLIPSLLHRLKFRPVKELSCTSQYQYPSMDIPLHLCFQMLDERISAAFENWTVFQPSKWTPLDILSLSWPIDLCGFETDAEVEGMVVQDLRQLVHNSLLEECSKDGGQQTQFDGGELCYKIHPLVHSYLLHCRPDGYNNFMKSLNYLNTKMKEESEVKDSKLKHYYSLNEVNLKKIEKNVGVMIKKQKKQSQASSSTCEKQGNGWLWKCVLFLVSSLQRLLGAS